MTLSPLTLAALRNGLVIFLVARAKISGNSSSRKEAFTLAHGLQDAVSRSREGNVGENVKQVFLLCPQSGPSREMNASPCLSFPLTLLILSGIPACGAVLPTSGRPSHLSHTCLEMF